jgi:23S rRNA (cytidine2498-2'-O)-methyltransferase
MSLGLHADLAAVVKVAERLPDGLRLHVFEREQYRPDETPPAAMQAAAEREITFERELRKALGKQALDSTRANSGDLVLSVVLGGTDPILVGLHHHDRVFSPFPGGRYPVEVPANTPSRAYRKIEEAIAAFDLPVLAGDQALELGSAPGGAVYALVRRGVSVIGVDPAAMDPYVAAYEAPNGARLQHIAKPMSAVTRQELPPRIDWLLLDVNLAPHVALSTARNIALAYRHSLLGAVLTLKLNQWAFLDELGEFEGIAREMGLVDGALRQLPSHRQELCIAGLTTRGQARTNQRRHTLTPDKTA